MNHESDSHESMSACSRRWCINPSGGRFGSDKIGTNALAGVTGCLVQATQHVPKARYRVSNRRE
jgi:hypothetical protein